ncbi:hypothetical protein [Sanguibacter suarezii]|uniref:hypothetical protein n=1 Tax=Sanguibacter suarezii TaxID=60921 RepID=UPI000A4BC933|nr:hypothetical protein [Sanguibacter suarezii]
MNYPGYELIAPGYELIALERIRLAKELELDGRLSGQLIPRTPLIQRVKRLVKRSA